MKGSCPCGAVSVEAPHARGVGACHCCIFFIDCKPACCSLAQQTHEPTEQAFMAQDGG